MSEFELLYFIPLGVVTICWFAFAAAFIFRKRPEKAVERRRDPKAVGGIALQAVGYAIIWGFRRDTAYLVPFPGVTFDIAIAIVTTLLPVGSVWMTLAAVKTLGKQWAVAARVVEGHQLITTGPYSRVRNPIYSGMLGMLVATGLAYSTWYALLMGIVIFCVGAMIRVKIEEKLLRETFGGAFDEYVKRVPPLLPNIF